MYPPILADQLVRTEYTSGEGSAQVFVRIVVVLNELDVEGVPHLLLGVVACCVFRPVMVCSWWHYHDHREGSMAKKQRVSRAAQEAATRLAHWLRQVNADQAAQAEALALRPA